MKSNVIELIKTSDKVLFNLSKRPKHEGKKWLAEKLGVSRPTLDVKINSNSFTPNDIIIMSSLGII